MAFLRVHTSHLLQGVVSLLQCAVGFLQHVVGDPVGNFELCLGHHLPAGDCLRAHSEIAGDDRGPDEV